jgi:hypothetical protein
VASDLPTFHQISYFFRQDGHQLYPKGQGRWTCLCPFHTEKTPSCTLNDEGKKAGSFHCFGCGAGNSVYDYLIKYRNITFAESLAIVRRHLNLPDEEFRRTHPTTAPPKDPLKLAAPLSEFHITSWHADCQRLLTSPDDITRIAQWRGFDESVVRWAASQQYLGLRLGHGKYCYGRVREAFPVRRPLLPGEATSDATSAHIGIHIRLGPGTPGNTSEKNSYRFDPTGIGSWPLVIGEPAAATHLFFIEGQWDAFALVQLLGWHTRPAPPITSAIIALRGAANWKLWLAHQPLREDATAYLFPDNDISGRAWMEAPPSKHGAPPERTFVESLTWLPDGSPRIATTHTFAIPGGEKDLNDALKKGRITPADFRTALIPLIRPSIPAKKRGTFLQYCKAHKQRPDIYGTAARSVIADPQRPPGPRPSLRSWLQHWQQRQTPDDLAHALVHLYTSYFKGVPLKPVAPAHAS